MRITFVLPAVDMSGGIRVVAIYAEKLKRRGHDVLIVSVPRRPPRLRRRIKSLLMGRGWPSARDPKPSHLDGVDVEHRVIERWRPITDKDVPDADATIATWWETAEWVSALSPGKGAKVHFIQGYEVFPGQPADRVKAVWGLPMHRITISKWLVALAQNTYSDTRTSLVPNSVDTGQFFATPRTKHAVPTVGLMYSSQSIKGLDVSLRAIELVKKTIPCLRLVSFGLEKPDGPVPLPSDAFYVQCPPQDSIRDLYAQCDVWLCGSRTEGFHLPPLEAMACRCPVVSTRVGGPLDIVEDAHNGFLVNIEDHEALADRLLRVLHLPDPEWRAMSDAAYATATRYTWDDATALFEQALFTAVKRTSRGDFQTACTAGSSPL